MSSIHVEARGVAFSFQSTTPILEGVELGLTAGWYGLVGANGSGKTTLLHLLSGALRPTEGTIRASPDSLGLCLVPQDVDDLDDDIVAFLDDDSGEAFALRGRLALDELEARARSAWSTLSPGERKRWQIGAALARDPDVLLLDEPTNHLDRDGRALLVGALRRFEGVGVVVSHDRALLDELTRTTIRVHGGCVRVHPGAYGAARREWELERRAAEDAHHAARREVRAREARLHATRTEHASAERARSSARRMKDKNDHDARNSLAKGAANAAAAKAGRNVGVARAAVDRAREAVPRVERDRTVGGHVFATYERAPRQLLVHLEASEIRAGADVILEDVRVDVRREDRLRFAGPNGAGKSTLLRALVDAAPDAVRSRTLVVPQELDAGHVRAWLDALASLDGDTRGRVLSVFATLGSDPSRVVGRRDATLSPGEARKLAFARGLGAHAWMVVLDEPTNHLDLPSVERLEDALSAYPGALVLATHDDAFAERCGTRSVEVRRDRAIRA